MTKSNLQEQTILEIVERIGKSIILREHEHFCDESIDNAEHIPRIKRIVEAIDQELSSLGISREKARNTSKKVKEYGKELFMKIWMESLEDGESEEDVREEGSYEFDSIYRNGAGL